MEHYILSYTKYLEKLHWTLYFVLYQVSGKTAYTLYFVLYQVSGKMHGT